MAYFLLSSNNGILASDLNYLASQHFREWRDLLPMQEKYLIQIRPPGDVMPDAFREMVLMQNATNAAILFDDTFGNYAHKNERFIIMFYF